jgi:hypothetical protein
MSEDEVFVTAASIFLGPIAWAWWFLRGRSIAHLRESGRVDLRALITVLIVCTLVIERTLRWGAAGDVRDAPQYVVMYVVLGLAWLRAVSFAFPLAGLHPRDDLLERRNAAALPAWIGAMVGVTCCYAGGNIGDGPGWWVVVFSAGLATATLAALWILVGQTTRLVDAVTMDRDPAAGWRLGGFLAACGMICGFAVTGDWVSVPATVADFVVRAWPVGLLAALAALVEPGVRPTPGRPRAQLAVGGIVPAMAFVAVALIAVALEWPQP